jgi:hypothetical protein
MPQRSEADLIPCVQNKYPTGFTGFTGLTGLGFRFPRAGKLIIQHLRRRGRRVAERLSRSDWVFSRSHPESGKHPVDPVNPV